MLLSTYSSCLYDQNDFLMACFHSNALPHVHMRTQKHTPEAAVGFHCTNGREG